MGAAAAIAGAGAVAGLGGSLISSGAAKSAADTQAAAANTASANALAQYQQTRTDLAPFRTAGNNASQILQAILGPQPNGLPAPQGAPQPAPNPLAGAPQGGGGQTGGSVLDFINSGQSFPGGYTLAYNNDSGQYSLEDAHGNTAINLVDLNSPLSNLMNQIGFVSGGAYGTPQTSSGSGQGTGGPGAPSAPGGNPLQTWYGIPSLTYSAPANVASVLANPQFNPTQAQLAATPGYQFDLTQGLQATQNSNAAQGLGVSGAALKGAASFATGLANNTLQTQAGIFNQNYTNALNANSQGSNIFQSNLGNVINPLEFLANQGQNAAATTGQLGVQGIQNANQALIGGANAQAAGTVGAANAISGGLSGLGNSATNYLLFNNLLNNPGASGTGFGNAINSSAGGFTSGGSY